MHECACAATNCGDTGNENQRKPTQAWLRGYVVFSRDLCNIATMMHYLTISWVAPACHKCYAFTYSKLWSVSIHHTIIHLLTIMSKGLCKGLCPTNTFVRVLNKCTSHNPNVPIVPSICRGDLQHNSYDLIDTHNFTYYSVRNNAF